MLPFRLKVTFHTNFSDCLYWTPVEQPRVTNFQKTHSPENGMSRPLFIASLQKHSVLASCYKTDALLDHNLGELSVPLVITGMLYFTTSEG